MIILRHHSMTTKVGYHSNPLVTMVASIIAMLYRHKIIMRPSLFYKYFSNFSTMRTLFAAHERTLETMFEDDTAPRSNASEMSGGSGAKGSNEILSDMDTRLTRFGLDASRRELSVLGRFSGRKGSNTGGGGDSTTGTFFVSRSSFRFIDLNLILPDEDADVVDEAVETTGDGLLLASTLIVFGSAGGAVCCFFDRSKGAL
jgi:hypothetical protein